MLTDLINNAAIMLSLSLLYMALARRWESLGWTGRILMGLLFGGMTVGVMMVPLRLMPGVVFDTRQIILVMAGLFGGLVPAIMAAAMALAMRLWEGGVGTLAGILTIIGSAGLGLAYRAWSRNRTHWLSTPYYLILGLLIIGVMLLSWLALPRELSRQVAGLVFLSVLIIYPLGTMLLALLLSWGRSRAATDRELHRAKEKYQDLYDHAPDMHFSVEPVQGRIIDCNQTAETTLGFSREELLSLKIARMYPPEWAPELKKANRVYREKGQVNDIELEVYRKDGSKVFVSLSITAKLDRAGNLLFSHSVLRDITLRKTAQDALREREADLRRAQKVAQVGSWSWDLNNDRMEWSDQMYEIFDLHKTLEPDLELVRNRILPEDLAVFDQALEEFGRGRMPDTIEYRIRGEEGKLAYLVSRAEAVSDSRGNPAGLVGTVQDVTENKITEGELKASEDRFKSLFMSAPLSYQALDENGFFLEVNDTWLSVLGYTREEVLGRHFSEFLDPDWKDHFKANFPKFKSVGEVLGVEFEMVKKDGSQILVSFHGKIKYDNQGNFAQTHCVFSDITDQRQAEEEKAHLESRLHQAEKMEAIGTLAGGIAHDFNNILAAIRGYTELALEDLDGSTLPARNLKETLKATERARELIRQILTFSRLEDDRYRPVKVQRVMEEALSLLRSTLPTTIEIRQQMDGTPFLIMGDPTQLHQILMNICANAAQAMESGGVLEVLLDSITDRDFKGPGFEDLRPGRYLRLGISDTGQGIPPDILEKIFDPFFTTKSNGKGTGMGLAVVHGIVRRMGGTVLVKSEPGKGTTFEIVLPLLEADQEEPPAVSRAIEGGRGSILLVDDEPSLTEVGRQQLMKLGYEVETRNDSQEALETFASDPDRFDLVITDQTMPRLTGLNLSRRMMDLKPGLPVILCTGYSESVDSDLAREHGVCEFLMKPMALRELAEAVKKALEGRTGRG